MASNEPPLRVPLWKRPYAMALLVGFLVVGVLACVLVLPPEWPLGARILAGLGGGLGSSLFVIANRLLG